MIPRQFRVDLRAPGVDPAAQAFHVLESVPLKIGGRKVIDRATFQTFGCQTAIAVASVATEMLAGKTVAEAQSMTGEELAAPLGALPPVKIHCAQLVEGALRLALSGQPKAESKPQTAASSPTLLRQLNAGQSSERKVKIILKK